MDLPDAHLFTPSSGREMVLDRALDQEQPPDEKEASEAAPESERFNGDLAAVGMDEPTEDEDAVEPEDGRLRCPHYLVMTATPIPRTLSLTVFGDLDVSVIDKPPAGRQPVKTRVVSSDQSDTVYRYLAQRVDAGEQAYVVVPAIDETGHETQQQLKSVRTHARLLKSRYLQAHEVASIHGRLKRTQRESIMSRFRHGDVRVLVATTVIEVGVDVPNATLMVVEHADRFGLAQLHQLRGRIGRGRRRESVSKKAWNTSATDATGVGTSAATDGLPADDEDPELRSPALVDKPLVAADVPVQAGSEMGSAGEGVGKLPGALCVFIADPTSEQSAARLKAIASTTDGFKIAEQDLLIRGMGDFFGTRQHGLPPLRVASLPGDVDLLQLARRDAQRIIVDDAELIHPEHRLLRKLLIQVYGEALGLIDVG